jgi:putative inorganic carbon (hco3(-)) transporter
VPNINPRNTLQILILFTFVALITFLPSWHFMPKVVVWFMDGQRLLELLLLGLILLDAVFNKPNQAIFKPVNYALFALLGLGTISSFLAQSPRHAFLELTTFVGLCYFAWFVAKQYYARPQLLLKRLGIALWLGILLIMLSFYVGYITATIFKTPLQWPLPLKGFTNVRHFNQFQLWSLGLVCLPLLDHSPNLGLALKKSTRIWLHIALVFWWVLLFYSSSRGVLLAWLVGIFCIAIIYKKLAWPFIRVQLLLFAAGYAVYDFLFKIVPMLRESILVTGTIMRETANDRIGLWQLALNLAQHNPIFGVGPIHYAWHSTSNAHPHNSVLQLASEWGLPATIIILGLISYGIYSWLKRFNLSALQTDTKLNSSLVVVLFFTLVANAAYSLVDGVIVMPLSHVMMFTVIGLMIGHYAQGTATLTVNKSLYRQIIAGVCLITLVWSSLPEILQGLSGNQKGFTIGYTSAGPRFWRESK